MCQTTSDWDSASIVQRIISCIIIGFALGTIIFIPLFAIVKRIYPHIYQLALEFPGVNGDWDQFVPHYIAMYTVFTSLVLIILQKPWKN